MKRVSHCRQSCNDPSVHRWCKGASRERIHESRVVVVLEILRTSVVTMCVCVSVCLFEASKILRLLHKKWQGSTNIFLTCKT